MSRFRVLVVDDEPLAREVVVDLLRRDTEVAGVTETGDPRGVPAILCSEHPDILFLDIEMPGLTGIHIASAVNDDRPAIVFVTAFSQYALEAFDAQAIDYLLKPFSDQRFFQALDRAKRRVRERRAGTKDLASRLPPPANAPMLGAGATPNDYVTRLAIGHGDHTLWIDASDIVWIEAEDYYVRLHTKQGRHLLRTSMASLEERLDPRVFVRSHRAAIVNVGEVSRIDSEGAGLVLSDGTQVAISRSRRPVVERVIAVRMGVAHPQGS
jgi:two-component system LytT family response regulator